MRERERGEERVRGGGGTRERRQEEGGGAGGQGQLHPWQTWRQEAWVQASQRSGWRSKAEETAREWGPSRPGGPGTGGGGPRTSSCQGWCHAGRDRGDPQRQLRSRGSPSAESGRKVILISNFL